MLLGKGQFWLAGDALMALAPQAEGPKCPPPTALIRQGEFAQVLETIFRGSLRAGVAITIRAALHPRPPFRVDSSAPGAEVQVRLQLLKRAVLRVCTHAAGAIECWQSRDGTCPRRRAVRSEAEALLARALPDDAASGRLLALSDPAVTRSVALAAVGAEGESLGEQGDIGAELRELEHRGELMVEVLVLAWAATVGECTSPSAAVPEIQRMAASLRAVPNAAAVVSLMDALVPRASPGGGAGRFHRRRYVLTELLDAAEARDLAVGAHSTGSDNATGKAAVPGVGLLVTRSLLGESLAELRAEQLAVVMSAGGINTALARLCVRTADEGDNRGAVLHARFILAQWAERGDSVAGAQRMWQALVSPSLVCAARAEGAREFGDRLVWEAFVAVPSAGTAAVLPEARRSEASRKLLQDLEARGREVCSEAEAFGALSVLGETALALPLLTKACARAPLPLLANEVTRALRTKGTMAFAETALGGSTQANTGRSSSATWLAQVADTLDRELAGRSGEADRMRLSVLRAAAVIDPGKTHSLLVAHARGVLSRVTAGAGAVPNASPGHGRSPAKGAAKLGTDERQEFIEWLKALKSVRRISLQRLAPRVGRGLTASEARAHCGTVLGFKTETQVFAGVPHSSECDPSQL
jgi:hypothetical protein